MWKSEFADKKTMDNKVRLYFKNLVFFHPFTHLTLSLGIVNKRQKREHYILWRQQNMTLKKSEDVWRYSVSCPHTKKIRLMRRQRWQNQILTISFGNFLWTCLIRSFIIEETELNTRTLNMNLITADQIL